MTDTAQMPASIVKAISAVQQTMQAVHKSQKNQHGGYMFASTDDIYAALTVRMGELGLICLCLEDGPPELTRHEAKGGDKTSTWMKISYRFVLATETDTWSDPQARRTLYLNVSGPQSFQAAQSYAEKSWLRSLFKIPTGDVDLDSLPEGFSPPAFRAPAPPLASGPAEAALAADRAALEAVVAEVPAAPPPPPAAEPVVHNMAAVMKNFEAAMATAKTREAAESMVDTLNDKYDGYISVAIAAQRDAAFEKAIARLK